MPATKVKVKLLKAWEYEDGEGKQAIGEVGELFNMDEETANKLVSEGTARIYDPEAEERAKKAVEVARQQRQEDIQEAVAAALATKVATENKRPVVESLRTTPDPTAGFKSLSEFVMDVARAGREGASASKLLESHQKQTMQEGDDAQGGYLVPTEFRAELLQTALEDSIITKRATFIPMETNRIEIPAMWDTDHTSGEFFGGVTIYRTGETAQKVKSKPTFGIVQLNLHKVTGLAAVTDSLLEDSPISIGPVLNKTFGQAMGFTMDNDFINGDGVNKPLGILNCNALVVISKASGQTADTIVADNVLNMYARMPSASLNNSIWVANHNTLPQIAQLLIGNYPMFFPAGGITQAPANTLLGRPLFFSEKMRTLGDQGDIMFIDPTQYLVGGKNGLEIKTATSIHLWFDYDLTAFRFVVRYDGVCWWKTYLTPKYGDTMSPYVVIEART